MARPRVDYDDFIGLSPAAGAVDIGNVFPAGDSPVVDLSGIVDAIDDVQRRRAYNEHRVAVEREQSRKEAEEDDKKEAEVLAAGIAGDERKLREAGMPGFATPAGQEHYASLNGEQVGDRAAAELLAFVEQDSEILGPDGLEKQTNNADARVAEIRSKYAGSYALATLDGANGFAKKFNNGVATYRARVAAQETANRVKQGRKVEIDNIANDVRWVGSIAAPSEQDWAFFQGAVVEKNRRAATAGFASARLDTLDGLRKGLLLLDPRRRVAAISHVGAIPLSNGIQIGKDIDGASMLAEMRKDAVAQADAEDRAIIAQTEREATIKRIGVREALYPQIAAAARSKQPPVSVLGSLSVEQRSDPVVAREVAELFELANRSNSAISTSTKESLMARLALVGNIDDELDLRVVKDGLNGEDYGELVALNRKAKDSNAILKSAGYEDVKKQVADRVAKEAFQNVLHEGDESDIRSRLQERLNPILRAFDANAQFAAGAQMGGDGGKALTTLLATVGQKGGLLDSIEAETAKFETERDAALAEVVELTDKRQSAAKPLAAARKVLGSREFARLERDNQDKASPERFLPDGDDFNERFKKFVDSVHSAMEQERAVGVGVPGMKQATYSEASDAAREVWGLFMGEFRKLQASGMSGRDIDASATVFLDDQIRQRLKPKPKTKPKEAAK